MWHWVWFVSRNFVFKITDVIDSAFAFAFVKTGELPLEFHWFMVGW